MNYLSAAERGTLIHRVLEKQVNALNDPRFLAEYSVIKSTDATRGQRHSVRIDVLENAGDGTVCVYDIKTGDRHLSGPRIAEIAGEVHSYFTGTRRILVIEVRPRK